MMKKILELSEKILETNTIYLVSGPGDLGGLPLSPEEKRLCMHRYEQEEYYTEIARLPHWRYVLIGSAEQNPEAYNEKIRLGAAAINNKLRANGVQSVQIIDSSEKNGALRALVEGLVLANYRFDKYYTREKRRKKNKPVGRYSILSKNVSATDLDAWENILAGVYHARDLVNEPVSYLNATQLSEEIKKLGKKAGFQVEVFNKTKIESLRMGGLLAVNKGSVDPPTFNILEWKPDDALNDTPIVLVGKGIVFDTGGLSLKPTKDSMDLMKSDMGGAAAVIGGMYALAKNNIPVHVVGLIPATDNRPDGNAYAPGDVITMMDGSTVEVLNTDAEGRMVLADALTYAKRYNPSLVVEFSTLTGAAAMAIGSYGIVGMGNVPDEKFSRLIASGNAVWERVVQFPFWDEYNELLKSEVADLKNIGGREGGAITAGKFLEHFTDYPYIHLDIAGPAFIQKSIGYKPAGGTGVGVRLIYHFIRENL